MTSNDPVGEESDSTPASKRTQSPHPEREPAGNYRPIDGPLPGVDGPGGFPDDPTGDGHEPIKHQFVDATREIEIPGGDPVSAGVLADLAVEDGVVVATLDCSGLDPVVAHRVGNRLSGIGLAIEDVEHVRFEAPPLQSNEGKIGPNGVDSIVAIAGAKGGTGKSTVTIALATALSEAGLDVGVFDADFQAPDVSELVGLEEPLPATAGGNPEPAVVDGIQLVSIDLIAGDRPVAWRGAMTHDVLEDLLTDAAWQDRDVLLVDLPPGLGDVAQRLFQRVAVDGAVLVTTPDDTSLRNVERSAGLLDACDVPVTAVVENMAGPGGIRDGDRNVEELIEAAPGDPRRVTIPSDPAFQGDLLENVPQLDGESDTAVASLTATIRRYLDRITATVPDDAIDLSGLPDGLQEKQAVLEVAVADDPVRIVTDTDDVPALLTAEFDTTVTVSDVDDRRRIVRAGGAGA